MNSQLIKKNMRHIKKYCTTVEIVHIVPIIVNVYCYGLFVSTLFGVGCGFKKGSDNEKNGVKFIDEVMAGAMLGYIVWGSFPFCVANNTYQHIKNTYQHIKIFME